MISCTDFIAAYSELFSYIDEAYGRAAVTRFWEYLFQPDGKGIPLVNFVQKEGIEGCFSYWSGTLSEESADFTLTVNPKRGYFKGQIHYCPSKGRLLQYKAQTGLTPYYDYCMHCDCYRASVEKLGYKYIFDFSDSHRAACNMLIYDPKVFDGRVIVDEDTKTIHRSSAQNEYFHPDFHSSLNMGVHYLGETYGQAAVQAYFDRYTKNVCAELIQSIRRAGLAPLEAYILDTYRKEKMPQAVRTCQTEDSLQVTVELCPGVLHLQRTGREVSPWYKYTTQGVMSCLAKACGYRFVMERYDHATGGAAYCFTKA